MDSFLFVCNDSSLVHSLFNESMFDGDDNDLSRRIYAALAPSFNSVHSLPKSRIVKFLFFPSSFGDLKANCCPADGRSWSFAPNVCIAC